MRLQDLFILNWITGLSTQYCIFCWQQVSQVLGKEISPALLIRDLLKRTFRIQYRSSTAAKYHVLAAFPEEKSHPIDHLNILIVTFQSIKGRF